MQPDNDRGLEHYIAASGMGWNDLPDVQLTAFMCEKGKEVPYSPKYKTHPSIRRTPTLDLRIWAKRYVLYLSEYGTHGVKPTCVEIPQLSF